MKRRSRPQPAFVRADAEWRAGQTTEAYSALSLANARYSFNNLVKLRG